MQSPQGAGPRERWPVGGNRAPTRGTLATNSICEEKWKKLGPGTACSAAAAAQAGTGRQDGSEKVPT